MLGRIRSINAESELADVVHVLCQASKIPEPTLSFHAGSEGRVEEPPVSFAGMGLGRKDLPASGRAAAVIFLSRAWPTRCEPLAKATGQDPWHGGPDD